jgi:hypothetical protein
VLIPRLGLKTKKDARQERPGGFRGRGPVQMLKKNCQSRRKIDLAKTTSKKRKAHVRFQCPKIPIDELIRDVLHAFHHKVVPKLAFRDRSRLTFPLGLLTEGGGGVRAVIM